MDMDIYFQALIFYKIKWCVWVLIVVWPFGKIKQIKKNSIFFQKGPKVEKSAEELVTGLVHFNLKHPVR